MEVREKLTPSTFPILLRYILFSLLGEIHRDFVTSSTRRDERSAPRRDAIRRYDATTTQSYRGSDVKARFMSRSVNEFSSLRVRSDQVVVVVVVIVIVKLVLLIEYYA